MWKWLNIYTFCCWISAIFLGCENENIKNNFTVVCETFASVDYHQWRWYSLVRLVVTNTIFLYMNFLLICLFPNCLNNSRSYYVLFNSTRRQISNTLILTFFWTIFNVNEKKKCTSQYSRDKNEYKEEINFTNDNFKENKSMESLNPTLTTSRKLHWSLKVIDVFIFKSFHSLSILQFILRAAIAMFIQVL